MTYQLVTVLYIRDKLGTRRKKVEVSTQAECPTKVAQLHASKLENIKW